MQHRVAPQAGRGLEELAGHLDALGADSLIVREHVHPEGTEGGAGRSEGDPLLGGQGGQSAEFGLRGVDGDLALIGDDRLEGVIAEALDPIEGLREAPLAWCAWPCYSYFHVLCRLPGCCR